MGFKNAADFLNYLKQTRWRRIDQGIYRTAPRVFLSTGKIALELRQVLPEEREYLDNILALVRRRINDYLSSHSFPELCRQCPIQCEGSCVFLPRAAKTEGGEGHEGGSEKGDRETRER